MVYGENSTPIWTWDVPKSLATGDSGRKYPTPAHEGLMQDVLAVGRLKTVGECVLSTAEASADDISLTTYEVEYQCSCLEPRAKRSLVCYMLLGTGEAPLPLQ